MKFFKWYTYDKKLPARYAKNERLKEKEWWDINLPNGKKVFVFRRLKPDESIPRMNMVYLASGEIFFIRMLLNNIPTRSHNGLRTVDGIIYGTFQLAAIKRGLCTDINEAQQCFADAIRYSTPYELRGLFVTMTLQGFPTHCIWENTEQHQALKLDFSYEEGTNQRISENKLLKDLCQRLKDANKTLTEYGFPEPESIETELQLERFKYKSQEQADVFNLLQRETPNTLDQEYVFQAIKRAIDTGNKQYFFIQGQAGTGKSTLIKKIMAYVRSQGKIALGMAATGLAAANFEDFTTMHSLLKIPVLTEDEVEEGKFPYST
jgi:ABC-type multidrug transport system fused ATPase/permease subunit